MKVLIKRTHVDDWEFDHGEQQWLCVNGKLECNIGRGEPEDLCLGRDLVSAQKIVSLMKLAYDAGKADEEWEVTETSTKGDE